MLKTNVIESCLNSRVPTKAKIRIAIADDHRIFRDGLCRFLSLEEDFDVAHVEEGLHVSEVLQQYDPDILLLDLNMPGLSGLATLQRRAAVFPRSPHAPPSAQSGRRRRLPIQTNAHSRRMIHANQ